MITLFNILTIIVLCFLGFSYFNGKGKIIKNKLTGFVSEKYPQKNDIHVIKGKRIEIDNNKTKLKNQYIKLAGDISELDYEIRNKEEVLNKKIKNYNNKLIELKNWNNSVSKIDLKTEKSIIEKENDILTKEKNRLNKMIDFKDHLRNKISQYDLKLSQLDNIIKDIEVNKNIRDTNFDFGEEDIIDDNEIDNLIYECEKLDNRYSAEYEAKQEFSDSYYNENNSEEEISLEELRLNI